VTAVGDPCTVRPRIARWSPRAQHHVHGKTASGYAFSGAVRIAAHLFDLSPFPAVVSRLADHAVLAINARTSEMFGIPQAQAVGLRVIDYYVDASQREKLVERLRRDGRADNLRIELKRPDGSTFWSQASTRLVTYAASRPC
jgi:PAS domain S-box-containing protein